MPVDLQLDKNSLNARLDSLPCEKELYPSLTLHLAAVARKLVLYTLVLTLVSQSPKNNVVFTDSSLIHRKR